MFATVRSDIDRDGQIRIFAFLVIIGFPVVVIQAESTGLGTVMADLERKFRTVQFSYRRTKRDETSAS